jgi:hypothetical protein
MAAPAHNNGSYANNSIRLGYNSGGDGDNTNSSRYRDTNNYNTHFHQHTSLFVENVLLDEPNDVMTTTLSHDDNSCSIMVAAVPIEDTSTFRALAGNRKVQIATVAAMVILLVAITLAIVLPISIASKNNSSTGQQPTPSQPPSDSSQWGNTKELFVQDILPDFTREKLQNSSSSQSVAWNGSGRILL